MVNGYMGSNTMDHQIKEILTRLEKLEKVVFPKGHPKTASVPKAQKFTGAKGGIMLLLSKNYFNQRRSAPDVKSELKKNEYDYSIQVVQTTLNRLSKGKGPLVAHKDGDKKHYVRRK